MPCYSPIHGYRKKNPNPSGKYGFTTVAREGKTSLPMTIPCGYCIGCRLEKSRQWAMRCLHEASLHTENAFITLTLSPESMRKRGTTSLKKREFQLFMKRVRKHYGNKKIRYYQCGEYGDKLGRPHYHAILFGIDFHEDRKPLGRKTGSNILYRSGTLEKLWGLGHCSIGDVTFESAAYVARYVTKKIYGQKALEHYTKFDKTTGEIIEEKTPEYTTMSRRPGIGKEWLERYQKDVYPKDHVHVRGKKSKPARYYDKIYEQTDPSAFKKLKAKRKRKQVQLSIDKTRPSLDAQERCATATNKNKRRSYENT